MHLTFFSNKYNFVLQNRVNVYMEFLETGRLDKLSVDNDQSEQLINLLDAVVIRLEGGTDFDLQVLEESKSSGWCTGSFISLALVIISE